MFVEMLTGAIRRCEPYLGGYPHLPFAVVWRKVGNRDSLVPFAAGRQTRSRLSTFVHDCEPRMWIAGVNK